MARDDLHQSKHDPNEIYIGGAKDADGHSTNIRCKIPDHWTGTIANFVASPDWPEYQTLQDFVRDAVFHRMQWASSQTARNLDPKVRTLMALVNGMAAIHNAAVTRQAAEDYVEKAKRSLSQAVSDGNKMQALDLIKGMEASLTDLPEPWRTQLGQELEVWERRLNHL